MTLRTSPPFRADHVGSLLRPRPLLEARESFAAGEITDEQLKETEDAAIADVVTAAGAMRVSRPRRTASSVVRSWHMGLHLPDPAASVGTEEQASRSTSTDAEGAISTSHLGRSGHRRHRCRSRSRSSVTPSTTVPSRWRPRGIDPEADDPVAEHGPLPRRDGRDRPEGLPRRGPSSGTTWSGAYAHQVPADRRTRVAATCSSTTPASPTLNDPDPAGQRRGAGTPTPSTSTRAPTSRQINAAGIKGPARAGLRVTTHMLPRQLPGRRGRPRVATTSSPRPLFSELGCRTASSWSTTTSAPAASNRSASCRRASQVVLGLLVTTKSPRLEEQGRPSKRRIDEASKYVDLRPALPVPPVRLLLHRRGQRPDRGRGDRQAAPRRRDRRRGLGIDRRPGSGTNLASARTGVWVVAAVVVALRLPFLDLPAWPDEAGFLQVGGGWHLGSGGPTSTASTGSIDRRS